MLDFSKNYFELFGLSVGYAIDRAALSERYRDLQRVLHPDRYANASDQERRLSMQGSTQINEAFETLKDPIRRAVYLLELNGVDLSAHTGTTHDAMFLMEQLELREQLEMLQGKSDAWDELSQFISRINGSISEVSARLAVLFDTPGEVDLDAAIEDVKKMQFLEKLRLQADAVEAELESAL